MYTVRRPIEFKKFEIEGTYVLEINNVLIQENNFPDKDAQELGIDVKAQRLSLSLTEASGQTGWFTIYSNLNKTTMSFDFNQNQMNTISQAIEIPVGTNFATIEDWINFIKGKSIKADVEINDAGYPVFNNIRSLTGGAF